MLHSRFLSSTSLALSLVSLAACGDDTCGPPAGLSSAGLFASNADVTLNYGSLTSGANNDCPSPDAPAGVISLTLQGSQVDGPGLLTLCIPRPDQLQEGTLALGGGTVQIIDLTGEADGCSYTIERLRPITGDVSVQGMCDNGASTAGYGLTIDGALSLARSCPTMSDTIAVTFAGSVAVAGE